MPARSKSQQHLFSMALAVRKGDLPRSKVWKAVLDIVDSDMTDKQIEDFTVLKEGHMGYMPLTEYIDHITESLEDNTVLDNLKSNNTYDGYTYYIGNTQVSVSNAPSHPRVNDSVSVCGKSKDIPCIISSVDSRSVHLKPIGGILRMLMESYTYIPQYAAPVVLPNIDAPAEVFVIIKPGFFNKSSDIVKIFEDAGFQLKRTRSKRLTLKEAQQLYKMHAKEDFYKGLCEYMSDDTTYGMIFSYKGSQKKAIKKCDELKDKIRSLWSKSDMKNVIHSSDSEENMQKERAIYFN